MLLEVAHERRAEVAEGLLAGVDGAVAAEDVERLFRHAERLAVADGADRAGTRQAFDHTVDRWAKASFGVSPGLILSGTLFAVTFAYLVRFLTGSLNAVEASLGKITRSMEDAARSLGAGPGGALMRVHVPLLAPSLATAALLVFLDVLKELPATFALRPFNFDTLAIEAYNLAKDERLAEAAAPALVIVAVGLLPVLYVTRRYFQATRS